MIRHGYKVTLITDAVKAVNEEGETESLKEMKEAGAVFITIEDVIKGKPQPLRLLYIKYVKY